MPLNKIKDLYREDGIFLIIVVATLLVLAVGPRLYTSLITPPGAVATGLQFTIPGDVSVYYSYIEQVRQGHWLLADLYTPEESPRLFNPWWLFAGLVARVTDWSASTTFTVLRALLAPVLVVVLYLFSRYFFIDRWWRRMALLFLTFSGGFGSLLLSQVIKYSNNFADGVLHWPLDIWVPELTSFTSVFYSPHFVASLSLLLGIFLFTLLFIRQPRWSLSLGAALCAGSLIWFHPFHASVIGSVLLMYALLCCWKAPVLGRRLLVHAGVVIIAMVPAAFYYFYLKSTDWLILVRYEQNWCPSAPFWLTVISYGPWLILATVATWWILRNKRFDPVVAFLVIWWLVQLGLVFSPLRYQRRLTEGLQIPLVLLSLWWLREVGVISWWRKLRYWRQVVVVCIFGISLVVAPFLTVAINIAVARDRRTVVYITTDLMKTIQHLRQLPGVVVLAASQTGNLIPGFSGQRVFLGHGVETPFYFERETQISWFFNDATSSDKVKHDWLRRHDITYVMYGPEEASLGVFDPTNKSYLQPVYETPTVVLYKVL